MNYRIPFGNLKIGDSAKKRISEIVESGWVSEGRFVHEFEEKFAAKFGHKHAIATSSGTDAGIVAWSAVRELSKRPYFYTPYRDEIGAGIITPACAFVATTNCLLAAGLKPYFIDIELETLNLDPKTVNQRIRWGDPIGIQFVATMGKPTSVKEVAEIAKKHDLWLVGDFCEGHGAKIIGPSKLDTASSIYADHLCDASIYSFYAAHLIVGGEGGIICTDDDEIAELCRSIKSHGRPSGSTYFNFHRVGFNSKTNEFCAAVALEGLENFDETFAKRREVRAKLIQALEPFEDRLILYQDAPGEIISPHAFPLVLKNPDGDIRPLYEHLDESGIQVKTLFGSLPTDHAAFRFLGYQLGDFPVAERIGRTGLHLPCNDFMTDDDVIYIADRVREFCQQESS